MDASRSGLALALAAAVLLGLSAPAAELLAENFDARIAIGMAAIAGAA